LRIIGARILAEAGVSQAHAFRQAVIAVSPDCTFISILETGAFVLRIP
jgi:hypothetical protein